MDTLLTQSLSYLESTPVGAGGSSAGAARLRFDRRDVFGGIFRPA